MSRFFRNSPNILLPSINIYRGITATIHQILKRNSAILKVYPVVNPKATRIYYGVYSTLFKKSNFVLYLQKKNIRRPRMKSLVTQLKIFILFVADIAVAFSALALTILLRYGPENFKQEFSAHIFPFSIIVGLFILVFYIFNLYSFRFNRNIADFSNSFIKSILISFAGSIVVFYIFGDLFKLTPKTNLLLFTTIFGLVDFYIRILLKRYFVKNRINRKVVLICEEDDSLIEELRRNQNIGYDIVAELPRFDLEQVLAHHPDVLVLSDFLMHNFEDICTLAERKITVLKVEKFYEEIFQKVPLEHINHENALVYINQDKFIYNFTKRMMDVTLSAITLVVLSPIILLITILIKITSPGPVLFPHRRVSLNGREFTIYKFRSMIVNAEKNGAVWTSDHKTDPRVTPFGKILRSTHLDEIPQLWNILWGDLSFVGPRPERPEFTKDLAKGIAYYNLRHGVKAGLTGWAQVNYRYGSSVEDAREKLKYDLYYIKNRDIFFDVLIILKTVAELFKY